MDQIPKFVLNNGDRGRTGQNGSNSVIRAELGGGGG